MLLHNFFPRFCYPSLLHNDGYSALGIPFLGYAHVLLCRLADRPYCLGRHDSPWFVLIKYPHRVVCGLGALALMPVEFPLEQGYSKLYLKRIKILQSRCLLLGMKSMMQNSKKSRSSSMQEMQAEVPGRL